MHCYDVHKGVFTAMDTLLPNVVRLAMMEVVGAPRMVSM
jgi:hypothetical protein